MIRYALAPFVALMLLISAPPLAADSKEPFEWPGAATAAISLTFDDGWPDQSTLGAEIFERYGARATFYVQPEALRGTGWRDWLRDRVGLGTTDLWRDMVAAGHEIGSHTINHPCSERFTWVDPKNAAENYTSARMERELRDTRLEIRALLNVDPVSFAYPCGHTTIGRDAQSYIPLVAATYQSARAWFYLHEQDAGWAGNDPMAANLFKIRAISMDDLSFDQLLPAIERARDRGNWIVLGGHDIGDAGALTTRRETLEEIIRYSQNPKNALWLAPVSDVVNHIRWQRSKAAGNVSQAPRAGDG